LRGGEVLRGNERLDLGCTVSDLSKPSVIVVCEDSVERR